MLFQFICKIFTKKLWHDKNCRLDKPFFFGAKAWEVLFKTEEEILDYVLNHWSFVFESSRYEWTLAPWLISLTRRVFLASDRYFRVTEIRAVEIDDIVLHTWLVYRNGIIVGWAGSLRWVSCCPLFSLPIPQFARLFASSFWKSFSAVSK